MQYLLSKRIEEKIAEEGLKVRNLKITFWNDYRQIAKLKDNQKKHNKRKLKSQFLNL